MERLRLPDKDYWQKPILAFNKKERIFFFSFAFLFFFSVILLLIGFYLNHTHIIPANGGILKEGLIGQPRFINPVYAESNDIDRDLVNLIFSGLMKYNPRGEIVPDIVSFYEVKEEGKIYEMELRKDVVFHDKQKLTADDVIFTIKTIQNPDFKSPLLAKWLGVDVEKISDYKVRFTLKNPYPGFIENLTVKILPAHIWEEVSSENFPFSPYNVKAIGSGPYYFKNIIKNNDGTIVSISLGKNNKYYSKKPYIEQIKFLFFEKEEDLIGAARSGQINAFSPLSPENYGEFNSFNKNSFVVPRYFAIFLNSDQNSFFEEKKTRQALIKATDLEKIKEDILLGEASMVNSPFLPDIYNFEEPKNIISFDKQGALDSLNELGYQEQDGKLVKIYKEETMTFTKTLYVGSQGTQVENLQTCLAKFEDIYPEGKITGYFGSKTKEAVIKFQNKYPEDILQPAGIKEGNGKVGPATREKLNEVCVTSPAKIEPLNIVLTTSNDPLLLSIAEEIKRQWEEIGISTEIQTNEIAEIKQELIKERNYQSLLFGQVLSIIPDPFSFWHSSQRNYPGLNLSNYKNSKLDSLLEKIRVEQISENRIELLQEAQEILIDDIPAIFICNPNYIYFTSASFKGIDSGLIADPSERFSNIENWYVKTKRSFK